MSKWKPIHTAPLKQDILLCWLYDNDEIEMRFGRLLYKPVIEGDPPIFNLHIDYGDTTVSVYTTKNDPPAFWMPKPEVPSRDEVE